MRPFHLASLATLLAVCFAAPAFAGGLYINEFATPAMGTAGAGDGALANDASTAFHNPAGMTRLDRNHLMLGLGFLSADVQFAPDSSTPIPGTDGGDQGGGAPILATYYVHSVSDRLKIGGSFLSVSATVLDPDDDWAGRFQTTETSVFTMSLTPTIAYRFNDWFSAGLGVMVLYGTLDMDVAVPTPPPAAEGQVELDSLDDFGVSFNASLLFEPGERTRIGFLYGSENELELSGDVSLEPAGLSAGIDTAIPYV